MAQRGTLQGRAYEYVKRLILDGRVRPGSRIEVEAVAERLAISRQPVRDAVNRLAAEGFVRVIPQVGCVVPPVDFADARDFLEAYSPFEGRLAGFAAQRRTPSQLASLERTSRRMAELVRDESIAPTTIGPPFRDVNRRLHREIHAMAASPTVERVADALLDRFDFYIASALWGGRAFYPEAAHYEHEAVIAAIRERDAARASEAMETHILRSLDRILTAVHGRDDVR